MILVPVLGREACDRWIAYIDAAMASSPILGGSLCMPGKHPDLSEIVRKATSSSLQDEDIIVSDRWFYTRYADARNGGTVEMGNHMDGTAWLEGAQNKTRSNVTLLLYLNDDFGGGHTTFMSGPPPDAVPTRSVAPEPGKALLLRQDAWHRGDPVTSGVKYLLRTDAFSSRPESTTGSGASVV